MAKTKAEIRKVLTALLAELDQLEPRWAAYFDDVLEQVVKMPDEDRDCTLSEVCEGLMGLASEINHIAANAEDGTLTDGDDDNGAALCLLTWVGAPRAQRLIVEKVLQILNAGSTP